jgi:hypothetical protein
MGKTQSKPLAARHSRGTACQGNGMVYVNYPLEVVPKLPVTFEEFLSLALGNF